MRIAVVVKSLKIGGMERAAINLAEAFANEGHEAHLIYFKEKDRALTPKEEVRLHLYDLEKIMKMTVIGFFWNIAAKLLNGLFRHSYFYTKGLFLAPIFRWKLRSTEKKYGRFDLVIIRGQGTFEMIWPLKGPNVIIQQVNILRNYDTPLQDFFRRALFSGKNVLCNAQSVKENLMHGFRQSGVVPRDLRVIPSPVNAGLIRERAEAYTPELTSGYIVNVGRFSPTKNLSLLIDAYAYAKTHLGLEHKLVLVGDGSLRSEIEAQISGYGLLDSVLLTGALKNPYPWLKHADLFVFTSKNEGLPNVLLESLACGTNIVATRGKGGTLDIMSGKLAENLTNFDAQEIAHKITELLQHPAAFDAQPLLHQYLPSTIVQAYIAAYYTPSEA
jgi:glycosyltransferase involved in cell wall biosynthesis